MLAGASATTGERKERKDRDRDGRPSLSPASSVYHSAGETPKEESPPVEKNDVSTNTDARVNAPGSPNTSIAGSTAESTAASRSQTHVDKNDADLPPTKPTLILPAPETKQDEQRRRGKRTLHASPVSDVPPGDTGVAGNTTNVAKEVAVDPNTLTPLRAHYLKKSLITLEFSRELGSFTDWESSFPNLSPLSYLGPPFTPPPRGAPKFDLPFLKFMFRQFVLTFPFVASAPKDFFPSKLQPFVSSLLARNLSTTNDILGMNEPDCDPELKSRQKILAKTEKYFSLVIGAAVKVIEPEEVVRLSQRDLNRLEVLARKRAARVYKEKSMFDVNIICVRTVVEKSRIRSRIHEEFIIRTRRTGFNDVHVSRRYGDFRTLVEELRKAHPEEHIKTPPQKDRSTVALPAQTMGPPPPSPINPNLRSSEQFVRSNTAMSSSEDVSRPSASSVNASSMAREKNRLTLRSYLHSLMTSSTIASSPVLRSFLLSGPTELTPDEVEDSIRREEADRLREEGKKRFAAEVAARVESLRVAVRSVKGNMMGKNGLTDIFATVKSTPNSKDLPPDYRAVLEWGRITFASTLFQNFVASDNASETFAALKRFHGLMPYFMLKGILRISNPMAMIRGLMDLFLAQPFGGKSLLQRMFTSSLMEESRALQEDIAAVSAKVGDPAICEKVRMFIYAPKEIQSLYRSDAALERINLLTVILRSSEQPLLNRAQMFRVIRAAKAHREYMDYRGNLQDSDDDDGPEEEDAWLYEDLNILAKLYSELRDKEQLIDLIFEGTTSDLLRDMISIFYAPLAQVYKAASIADSLGDLQTFINDLVKTVENIDSVNQDDPNQTVQVFINLVERHEQSFYTFVHKVQTKGEGLFDSLMHWIELFLGLTREGLGESVSLEFILPHTGAERELIMKEVDVVALYHYKLKLSYEEKLRRRFGRAQARTDAEADDHAAQELVNGVVRELSFGDLVKGDANHIAAEETESETEDTDTNSEEESDSEESEEESSSEEEGSTSGNPTPKLTTPVATTATPVSPRSAPTRPIPPIPVSRKSRSPVRSSPNHSPASSAVRSKSQARASDRERVFRQTSQNTPPPPLPSTPTLVHTTTAMATSSSTMDPTRPRPRIRASKSFSSSDSYRPPLSAPPPVPAMPDKALPLPPMPHSAGSNKPFSNNPNYYGASLSVPSSRQSSRPSSANNNAHTANNAGRIRMGNGYHKAPRRKKNGNILIEQPELVHIPKLLPLFMEMIRPMLRPQAI